MGTIGRIGALLASEAYYDSQRKLKSGPVVRTRILNKDECLVASVSNTLFGDLCFRDRWAVFPIRQVEKVIFLRSSRRKEYEPNVAVEADFDIYTKDGRVIEVWSCDRAVLTAALKYAPEQRYIRRR